MSNTVKITDIINGDTAVSTSEGNSIYALINENLKNKRVVIVDFEGVKFLTTAFLNAALGQLYSNTYSSEFLNEHLKIRNVTKSNVSMFEIVITRAKEYFRDKDGFEGTADSSLYGK